MTSVFVSRIAARSLHVAARAPNKQVGLYPNTSGYKKFKELQNFYCKEDGRFIWQKNTRDTLLYRFTMGVFALGWIPLFITLYKLSFPQKKD